MNRKRKRRKCTADNPSDRKPWEWYHPDAKLTGETGDGFYDDDEWDEYDCPHCGLVFKVTVSK